MKWSRSAPALNNNTALNFSKKPLSHSMFENLPEQANMLMSSHSYDTVLVVAASGRAWALWISFPRVGLIRLHGFCSMSTSRAHRMHSVSHWQTADVLVLHMCEVRVRSYFLLISCFFLQGFDDQPGVESQRLLSAQRRHHLLQSISIQLDDLQVEAESSIPPTPQLKPTFSPALPRRLWTLFLLHSQSLTELKHACTNRRQRIKKIWGKKTKKNRDRVQF